MFRKLSLSVLLVFTSNVYAEKNKAVYQITHNESKKTEKFDKPLGHDTQGFVNYLIDNKRQNKSEDVEYYTKLGFLLASAANDLKESLFGFCEAETHVLNVTKEYLEIPMSCVIKGQVKSIVLRNYYHAKD